MNNSTPMWGAQHGYQTIDMNDQGQVLHAETIISNDTPNHGISFAYGDQGGFSIGNFLPWGDAPLLKVWGDFHISFGISW